MGINPKAADIEQEIMDLVGFSYEGLSLCELGNQSWRGQCPAKEKYEGWGVNHTSIDLNGRDGALKIDLNEPITEELKGEFDVVTDYGTIEHVNDLYMAFKNMHDLCKVGGVMIHASPKKGHWGGHGRYYFTEEDFEEIAILCGYELILLETQPCYPGQTKNDLVHVALKKLKQDFINRDSFNRLNIYDSGDMSHVGDYDK